MAVVEVSVIPVGTTTPSISSYVASALKVLEKEEDIKYELTPMGTIIEGKLDRILDLAKRMHEALFSPKIERVLTTIVIDDRRDKTLTMEGKVRSVREKLGGV